MRLIDGLLHTLRTTTRKIDMGRKSCRLLPWVALLGMATAHAQAPSAAAQEQMLGLLQEKALYRAKVDWTALRRALAATDAPDAQRGLLLDAINRATAGHGGWLSPDHARNAHQKLDTPDKPPASVSLQSATVAETPRLDPRLGMIHIGAYLPGMGLSRAQQREAEKAHALALQATIRAQGEDLRCGWIVDLRDNQGGNMWPMLLGAGPLLQIDEGDDTGTIGYFWDGAESQPWRYHNGSLWIGTAERLSIGAAAYTLDQPTAAVAVLVSRQTASSGEAVVLAFRAQPNSRSFGMATAGYSTGNVPVTLVDGSTLLLTNVVMQDRRGVGDGQRIIPDVTATDANDALRLAQEWLLQQPACALKHAAEHSKRLPDNAE